MHSLMRRAWVEVDLGALLRNGTTIASRAGIQWDAIDSIRDTLVENTPQGAFTHFHSAERNNASRDEQERRFSAALAALPARPTMVHAENSAAVEHRGPSQWDVARPGIFLYGVGSGNSADIVPEAVVAVRARVVDVRSIPAGDTVGYGGTYRAP